MNILALVLVIFGAGRLPQVGASLGKGLRSFKDGLKGQDEQGGNGRVSTERHSV